MLIWLVNLREIIGKLGDLSGVALLNIDHEFGLELGDQVDGDSSSSVTTGTSNSMDVVLLLVGEVEVDDQTNLMDVDTSGEEIGGDQHS